MTLIVLNQKTFKQDTKQRIYKFIDNKTYINISVETRRKHNKGNIKISSNRDESDKESIKKNEKRQRKNEVWRTKETEKEKDSMEPTH